MNPVHSLGWILIEDSALKPGAPVRPGFEAHAGLEETRRRIEDSGAQIVAMHSSGSGAQGHDTDFQRIARRCAVLVERRPDLADLVTRYLERQREECAFLEQWTDDVTWLLRKPRLEASRIGIRRATGISGSPPSKIKPFFGNRQAHRQSSNRDRKAVSASGSADVPANSAVSTPRPA